jgi:glycosyltransferase involved in cell wall biosynthesis
MEFRNVIKFSRFIESVYLYRVLMDDRISIIVPTYNRREMLQRLLESFCRLQCHCPLEFIIVDDCSDDGTGGMVEEWRKTINSAEVKYHRLASRSGPARARNAGIILATGNIIAFTDSDCIVDPRWAEQLYQRLISCPEYAGAGGECFRSAMIFIPPIIRYSGFLNRNNTLNSLSGRTASSGNSQSSTWECLMIILTSPVEKKLPFA